MSSLRPDRLGQNDARDQPVSICGKAFRAHMSGALYWPAEKALIVSDLELASRQRTGAYGKLSTLAEVIDTFDPATVIVLGDSPQEGTSSGQIDAADLETIRILQDNREWIWITGEQNAAPAATAGGHILPSLTVEGISLRHRPRPGAITHEISGHLHPAARLVMHGTALRRPCFVSNGLRLIMPAFAAFTGGRNILDPVFDPLLGQDGMTVWMLGQDGLYPVATRLLKED